MMVFAILVVIGTLVLFGIHARATNGAFKEMGLLKFLSYNRLTMLTMVAAITLMIMNMFTHVPLITGVVFLLLGLLWLYRTIHAVSESKANTGKTNIQYTYQKMFNEMGQEIDAEAIEQFIDGRMEDLNEEIDHLENELSDEQRRLIDADFDGEGEPSDEDGGEQPGEGEGESDKGESQGEGSADDYGDGKGTGPGDAGPTRDDSYTFSVGQKVKVVSVPKGTDSSLVGTEFVVGIRLPNIKLSNPELSGHGYWVAGTVLPTECLKSV